jgi:hypothetical protein
MKHRSCTPLHYALLVRLLQWKNLHSERNIGFTEVGIFVLSRSMGKCVLHARFLRSTVNVVCFRSVQFGCSVLPWLEDWMSRLIVAWGVNALLLQYGVWMSRLIVAWGVNALLWRCGVWVSRLIVAWGVNALLLRCGVWMSHLIVAWGVNVLYSHFMRSKRRVLVAYCLNDQCFRGTMTGCIVLS